MDYVNLINSIKANNTKNNLLAVEQLFSFFFVTQKTTLTIENIDFYKDIATEYIAFTVKRLSLNISASHPKYIEFDTIKNKISEKQFKGLQLTLEENNVRKLIVYNPKCILHWGKYSGQTILQVLKNDIDYIIWCVINVNHFAIQHHFLMLSYAIVLPDFPKAIEINSTKHLIIKKWGTDSNDGFKNHNNKPFNSNGPKSYGYDSWDEMNFNEAFDGDIDAWNHYNQ